MVLAGMAALILPLVVAGCDAVLIGRELLRDDTTSAQPLEVEGVRALTDDKFLYVRPTWSPDGATIGVSRNMESQALMGPAPSEWDIVLVDMEGEEIEGLPPADSKARMSPAWSPDGRQLAFVDYDGQVNRIIIYSVQNGARRVLNCATCDYLVWSDSGDSIVAAANLAEEVSDRGQFGIVELDQNSGQVIRELVLGEPFLGHFSLAPGGDSILITEFRCMGIWQVFLESANVRPFIDSPDVHECDPAFSADGSKIVYTVYSPEERFNSIIIANADGSSPQELFRIDGAGIHHPAWSPDGTRLAFVYGLLEVTAPSFSTLYIIDVPPELQP